MQSFSVDPNHMSSRWEDSADFGRVIQLQASSGALLAKENFNFSQTNSFLGQLYLLCLSLLSAYDFFPSSSNSQQHNTSLAFHVKWPEPWGQGPHPSLPGRPGLCARKPGSLNRRGWSQTLNYKEICPIGFWTCSGPIIPSLFLISPFWNRNVYFMCVPPLYFRSI